jgi:hypothetical protein
MVASILTGRDESLPKILLDADAPGKSMEQTLKARLYATEPDKVLSVENYVEFQKAEVEDLFPPEYLAAEVDRMEREPDERLSDVIQQGLPFVGQVEQWAKKQNISLNEHWKVQLAIRIKQRALTRGITDFDEVRVDM